MTSDVFDRRGRPVQPEVVHGMLVVGRWLRALRRRRGYTQAQLGRLCGLHQSTISRLENGRCSGLRWIRFAALVAALDGRVPVDVTTR
jgi:transcriptional regulator with XRE-family HTH domain